jgi:hypothetical protein
MDTGIFKRSLMDLQELTTSIVKDTDLNKNDELKVSRSIPHYYSLVVLEIHRNLKTLNEANHERDLLYGDKVKYFIEKYDFEIKNKSDRDHYINAEKEINEKNIEIGKIKNNLTTLDNLLKYLKDIQYNIKNIIDLEKMKRGE